MSQKTEREQFEVEYWQMQVFKTKSGILWTFVFCKSTQPDPKKVVSAFVNCSKPTTVSEICSLLGMANFSAQLIKDFATITEPLRRLTCTDTVVTWGSEQDTAYDTFKQALMKSPVMVYFDTQKESIIMVDASPVGLSAILAQREHGKTETKIIAYASHALSATERRYSQTEKEGLAIVWGIEHFHLNVYGARYTLYTDHRPLALIY